MFVFNRPDEAQWLKEWAWFSVWVQILSPSLLSRVTLGNSPKLLGPQLPPLWIGAAVSSTYCLSLRILCVHSCEKPGRVTGTRSAHEVLTLASVVQFCRRGNEALLPVL